MRTLLITVFEFLARTREYMSSEDQESMVQYVLVIWGGGAVTRTVIINRTDFAWRQLGSLNNILVKGKGEAYAVNRSKWAKQEG
ncbi:hypothetical protein [Paenibacillus sp. LjRoot56]|uniref:hypothetical protein n=1 Tax=Paenibacillus sp. LjRoot56 TaxID=3342333 RepID=UPI003ED0AE03